jgi:hypothetical protein
MLNTDVFIGSAYIVIFNYQAHMTWENFASKHSLMWQSTLSTGWITIFYLK